MGPYDLGLSGGGGLCALCRLPFYQPTVFLTGRNFRTSYWPSPAKKTWLWEITRRLQNDNAAGDRHFYFFKKSSGARRRKTRAKASSSARPNSSPRVDVSTAQKHLICGRQIWVANLSGYSVRLCAICESYVDKDAGHAQDNGDPVLQYVLGVFACHLQKTDEYRTSQMATRNSERILKNGSGEGSQFGMGFCRLRERELLELRWRNTARLAPRFAVD